LIFVVRTPQGYGINSHAAVIPHKARLERVFCCLFLKPWPCRRGFFIGAPAGVVDMRMPTREDGLMELHKMNGHWKDDARVEIKLSARQHKMFSVFGIQQQDRSWSVEAF